MYCKVFPMVEKRHILLTMVEFLSIIIYRRSDSEYLKYIKKVNKDEVH